MEAENYEVRYIGDKISAIKVLSGDGDDGSGEVFVTGSYDSKVDIQVHSTNFSFELTFLPLYEI